MARKGVKNIQSTKTEIDGIKFASKFEASRYQELKLMEVAREIFHLRCHVSFPLQNDQIAIRELRGDKIRTYTPDFIYVVKRDEPGPDGENYQRVAEETKGIMTGAASLRLSCFKAFYPDIDLRVIKQRPRKKYTRKKKT